MRENVLLLTRIARGVIMKELSLYQQKILYGGRGSGKTILFKNIIKRIKKKDSMNKLKLFLGLKIKCSICVIYQKILNAPGVGMK